MSLSSIQRFTVFVSQRVRQACTLLGKRLVGSPRLNGWFYPPLEVETSAEIETPAEKYRQFNEHYFADLHERSGC